MSWTEASEPQPGQYNVLADVAAIPGGGIWAVGDDVPHHVDKTQTLWHCRGHC